MTTPELHRGIPVKQTTPLSRVRKMMAQSMEESVRRAALSQVTREMDLSAVQAARAAAGEQRHSLNTYIMAAVARALPNHPLLNAELVENAVVTFDAVNLGMAVAAADGLVVAVICDADKKSLDELTAAASDLATRARAGKLKLPDIEGGTFTVSNLGMFEIDGGFPLPRPPEGAILLVGRVRDQPALVNGKLVERPTAWFSLTFDHRFIDGAAAAAFLQEVQEKLAEVASA
jgi:pyruvate dehydrogenase E2 component (dihydrolipoamide acetyltransferase)